MKNPNFAKRKVEGIRNGLQNTSIDDEGSENNQMVKILKNDVKDAKLVCSTPIITQKISYGFTAESTFHLVNFLPIKDAIFQHDNKEFIIKYENKKINLKIIFRYQSFIKFNYEIYKRTENSFDIKIIFIINHAPLFFGSEKIIGNDGKFIRVPVLNDANDPLYYVSRSTAFQINFCLEKPDLEAFFLQLYSNLACSITPKSYTEESENLAYIECLDAFTLEWSWNLKYYMEMVKSCGLVGSFFLKYKLCDMDELDIFNKLEPEQRKMYLTGIYEHLKSDLSLSSLIMKDHAFEYRNNTDSNYVLLKTAYVTPSRILYTFEETTLNCRGFRKLGIHNLLLVKFRDDNLQNFPPEDVDERIVSCCQNGIEIAGQTFYEFGGSSSLFREHGTYFYSTNQKEDIPKIWKEWGKFKVEPAAKVAARIGQYFTSAKVLGIKISHNQVEEIDDFMSTATDNAGNPYCFSDGVGLISQSFAKFISQKLELPYLASAYQIRYAGFKGMVSLSGDIDYPLPDKHVCLRGKQKKFEVNFDGEDLDFDIVQASAANSVSLHKIFIVMLDALAQKQGRQVILHERLRELQNDAFTDTISPLTDNTVFMNVLEKLPKYIPVAKMATSHNLIHEPFLRSMVEANAVLVARSLASKQKIPIPSNLGRNALGVVDTSDKLEPGQIFFQYSDEIRIRSDDRITTILKGKVGVTKSPIHHAGDIRFLTAVDVPELRHLKDVIVFPSKGNRPIPDEIGGGDLDGDMYVVFWDPAWILEGNVDAADYTAPNTDRLQKVNLIQLQQKLSLFRSKYTKKNNIDKLCSAHLAHLIIHKPDHPDIERIANKADIAVNFFKSGWAADNLSEAERPGHWPKCMGKRHEPAFTNSHIICQLHEQADTFYHLIQIAQNEALQQRNAQKKKLTMQIFDEDRQEFELYKAKIEDLMNKYQIKSEGELFANALPELIGGCRNQKRFGENSIDAIIQQKVFDIFKEHRTKVLNRFHSDWNFDRQRRNESFFEYQLRAIKPEMVDLAKRYYALAEEDGTCLSFPWIAWEGLDAWWKNENTIKPNFTLKLSKELNGKMQPRELFRELSLFETKYTQKYSEFKRFITAIDFWRKSYNLKEAFFDSAFIRFIKDIKSENNNEIKTYGNAFIDFLTYLCSIGFSIRDGNEDQKLLYKTAQSTLVKIAFFPEDNILNGINLQQQIITYPPFVIHVPNMLAPCFQQNYKLLEAKSGCKEIAVCVRKTAQSHYLYSVMCRGTLEACQKLEAMLTPIIEIENDNTISIEKIKKKKNEKMQEILEDLFSQKPLPIPRSAPPPFENGRNQQHEKQRQQNNIFFI